MSATDEGTAAQPTTDAAPTVNGPAPADDRTPTTDRTPQPPTDHAQPPTAVARTNDGTPPTSDDMAPDGIDPDGTVAPPTPLTTLSRQAFTAAGRWAQVITAGIVGALPVLWVLGAVPWRLPTLLIENMFTGFSACARADGSLNPIVMVCPNAGVPLGMYQLDGGLSYPLGGVLIGWGLEPLDAWKLAVALLIVPGVAAMFWLVRGITGSATMAAGFVVLYGLSGSMTARSWNWYWNLVSVALLPLLFALVYALYAQADGGRLRRLLLPGAGVLVVVLAISIEWQYAGMFAASVALGGVAVLVGLRGWAPWQRVALAVGGGTGLAVVYAVLQLRLNIAGVGEQFNDTLLTAWFSSVDLAALVAPDAGTSLTGRLLASAGQDAVLARSLVEGPQLWVAPYLGVLTLVFLAIIAATRRGRLVPNPRLPTGFLLLVALVVIASIVLSLGPVVRVSWLGAPTAWRASPLMQLWISTPLQWIRYPWTWAYLTHTALLIGYAILAAGLLRRPESRSVVWGSWSPLVWVLAVVLTLDMVSPQAFDVINSDRPSVATAPDWARIDRDDPGVAQFQTEGLPEVVEAMRAVDGPMVVLPWGNDWAVPLLGTGEGLQLRNTGIDRNVAQVEAAAPFGRHALRRPRESTVQRMLRTGWVNAVVMLEFMPTTGSAITRLHHRHPTPRDLRRRAFIRSTGQQLRADGFCVQIGSWFTVISRCPPGDLPSAAGAARGEPEPLERAKRPKDQRNAKKKAVAANRARGRASDGGASDGRASDGGASDGGASAQGSGGAQQRRRRDNGAASGTGSGTASGTSGVRASSGTASGDGQQRGR